MILVIAAIFALMLFVGFMGFVSDCILPKILFVEHILEADMDE